MDTMHIKDARRQFGAEVMPGQYVAWPHEANYAFALGNTPAEAIENSLAIGGVSREDIGSIDLIVDPVADAVAKAGSAKTLTALWDAVEDYEKACDEACVDREHGGLDFQTLPTFGGTQVEIRRDDVLATWSWDETHALVQTDDAYTIVPR